MSRFIHIFVFMLLVAPPTWAAIPSPARTQTEQVVQELVEKKFPELQGVRISFRKFHEAGFFFQTGVAWFTLGRPGPDRKYFIDINEAALAASPIGDEELRGVLAHELSHLVDYIHMTGWQMVSLGLHYTSRAQAYERATDVHALERGYARELRAFRIWLYRQLTDDELAVKKKNYMTPEEIDAWTAIHPQ